LLESGRRNGDGVNEKLAVNVMATGVGGEEKLVLAATASFVNDLLSGEPGSVKNEAKNGGATERVLHGSVSDDGRRGGADADITEVVGTEGT
jgi:hypothetical protein